MASRWIDDIIGYQNIMDASGNVARRRQTLKIQGGQVFDDGTNTVLVVSPTGMTGFAGPTGSRGATGIQGATGVQGPTGQVGPTGPRGNTGANGIQGAQGVTGAQGIQGNVGATGPQGATGVQGIQGPTGTIGATGAQGIQGNAGATGVQGQTGPRGNTGANGIQGAQGVTGAQGVQGVAGSTGSVGPQGVQGQTGPRGNTGANGIQGIQGVTGVQGPAGPTGPKGDDGDQGSPGINGSAGVTGPRGATGVQGPQGQGIGHVVREEGTVTATGVGNWNFRHGSGTRADVVSTASGSVDYYVNISPFTATVSSSTQMALPLAANSDAIESSNNLTIAGIANGSVNREVKIYAGGNHRIKVAHQDPGATAVDQCFLTNANNYNALRGGIHLRHDGTSWREIARSNALSTDSELIITGFSGNLGTINIASLQCGGSVVFSAMAGDFSVEGFTLKEDGFWFYIVTSNAETQTFFNEDVTASVSNRMRISGNVNAVGVGIQGMCYYKNSRWRAVLIPGSGVIGSPRTIAANTSLSSTTLMTDFGAGSITDLIVTPDPDPSNAVVCLFDEHFYEVVANTLSPASANTGDAFGNIGSWKIAGNNALLGTGAAISVGQDPNHVGVVAISTSATNTRAAGFFMASTLGNSIASTSVHIDPDAITSFDVWVKLNSITSVQCQVGFASDATSATPSNSITFNYDPAVVAGWTFYCRAAGSSSASSISAIPVVAGDWYKLSVKKVGSTVSAWVNNVRLTDVTTNVPTSNMCPAIRIVTLTSSSKRIDMDRFRCYGLESQTIL